MALPSNVGYGTVTARFLLAYADGSDVDAYPDGVAAAGSVTFTPSAAYIKNVTASPSPVTIIPSAITCSLDSEGYLLGTDGNRGVKLVATDDQDNNPVGWTWTVSFALLDANGANAGNLSSFSFSLATDATVDLASVSPVPSANGTFYITAPATTLSIGTVTTGAPGSSAAVSISGTAPSQTLNFTIPQGPAGATGAAGADGSLTGLSATSPITYSNSTIALADVSPSPAGTYGSSSVIPSITVDAKGRVTAVSTNTVSGGGTWSTYTPTLTGITLGTDTTMSAKYTQIGKTVHFRVHFSVSANANALTINVGATVGLPVASVNNASTGFSMANILFVGRDATLGATSVSSPAVSSIGTNNVTIKRQVRVANDGIVDAGFYDGYPINYLNAYATPRYLSISGTYEAA